MRKYLLPALFGALLGLFAGYAHAQQLVEEQPNFYKNVTTSTTTVVKADQGRLHAIVVNNKGSTATVTMYDNASAASGTKIGTMSLTAEATFIYDVAFAKGLTIVTTGAPDLTVSFR